MTKATTKQIVAEMTKNAGNPVRLMVRNHPSWGGWMIERQNGVTMGAPYSSHEAALAAVSKAWVKAWEGVA